MSDHEALRNLGERQHGVVARRQLTEIGFTPQSLDHAIRSGRLERMTERVLRIRGSAPTELQKAMAATLDVPGSAIALHSAAALWGVPGFTAAPWHVMSSRRPHRGGVHLGLVHSSVRWCPEDSTMLHGVPVTTPIRTLVDLAPRVRRERLSDACDRMLDTRVLRLEQLHALGTRISELHRSPGVRALQRLVADRPPGYRPAGSNLERRFESILAEAGEAPFERQVDLGDDLGWIGRVDFVDRDRNVVVEIQSDLFHAGLVARQRDEERIDRLRRAGWTVVEVTEFEVWHRKELVLDRIRAARRPHPGSRRQA